MSSTDSSPSPSEPAGARRGREMVVGAMFAAAGVALPVVFHALGMGKLFLPMHLPILLCGCLVSPVVAAAAGFITPWVSWAATGMPPFPYNVTMAIELPVLGAAAALMARLRLPIWLVVPLAILCRCVATVAIATLLGPALGLPAKAAGIASLAASLPGVALQLVVVPPAALMLRRREAGTL